MRKKNIYNIIVVVKRGTVQDLSLYKRFFLYPLLSPSEREFQLVIMKRFQKFQVKDLNMKYNFRIYTSGYDLKVKTDEKAAFFKLKSGDVKEMISDQIIKKNLIEETGVSI